MKTKIVASLFLLTLSFSSFSASFINIPLGKKCYSIYQKLDKLADRQATYACRDELQNAAYYTKYAALDLSDDSYSGAHSFLKTSLSYLNHAQIYDCDEQDEIASAAQKVEELVVEVNTHF